MHFSTLKFVLKCNFNSIISLLAYICACVFAEVFSNYVEILVHSPAILIFNEGKMEERKKGNKTLSCSLIMFLVCKKCIKGKDKNML